MVQHREQVDDALVGESLTDNLVSELLVAVFQPDGDPVAANALQLGDVIITEGLDSRLHPERQPDVLIYVTPERESDWYN